VLRGRRVRIVLRCPEPCSGLVRVRAGRRILGTARVRRRVAGRRIVHVRLRASRARRARVTFGGARSVTVRLVRPARA